MDPLPIPFNDPEPQVTIPYSHDYPWHTQIHRDAFNYGDVGPRADSRVVVDLRFFGKQDVCRDNMVFFGQPPGPYTAWQAGVTDIYGMPQPTVRYSSQRTIEQTLRFFLSSSVCCSTVRRGSLTGSEVGNSFSDF
jgi:pyranose oxidase